MTMKLEFVAKGGSSGRVDTSCQKLPSYVLNIHNKYNIHSKPTSLPSDHILRFRKLKSETFLKSLGQVAYVLAQG
jgi:hypothetical protein